MKPSDEFDILGNSKLHELIDFNCSAELLKSESQGPLNEKRQETQSQTTHFSKL